MAKRKSLDEALSPEEEDFLDGGKAGTPARTAIAKSKPTAGGTASRENKATSILPPVPDLPDSGLATLNVRIEPSIVAAILRASMVRKIQKEKPSAQREIVADAIRDWLRKHGYQS